MSEKIITIFHKLSYKEWKVLEDTLRSSKFLEW